MKIRRQKGQVALIVVVISALALTLGLSLSDKIRSGVKVSKDDELLQKAFDAAESTLESYYASGDDSYNSPSGDAVGSLSVNPIVGTTVPFTKYVRSDEYAFFWLVGHESDGDIDYSQMYGSDDLTICYNNFAGGLLVYYFYREESSYEVTRSAYNLTPNYFGVKGLTTLGGSQCPGYDSYFSYTLNPSPSSGATPLLLIVKPVGGGSNFMVSGGNVFPSQGNSLSALGTSGVANAPVTEENRWDPTKYMFFMLEGIVSQDMIN